MDVLDLRDLNRATLARQCLLERIDLDVATMVARVGGIQAQTPANPMVALWSRLARFQRADLVAAAIAGSVVRGTSLRGTLHLHEVDDYRALRMSLQPMLDAAVASLHRRVRDADLEPAFELGRSLIEESPRTIGELKRLLGERFPGSTAQGLGNLVRHRLQLLMVPEADAPNGWPTLARFTPATELVGDTLAPDVDRRLVVRRFLEVLGPGTPKDAQTWSGVRGLKPVMQEMLEAGELVELTTFEGDVLFDLPDAPRPGGDAPAGVRFLPMWDNLLLSHADRSRVIDPKYRPYVASKNGMPPPTFLVDGFVHGTWTLEREGDRARLQLAPFTAIPTAAQDAIVREGEALVAFLAPGAGRVEVRLG